MDTTVTLHLKSTFDHILTGKFYYFFKRSFWRYLIASLMLAFVCTEWFGSFLSAFIYLFGMIMCIAMVAIYLSSKYMASKNLFDADVEFSNDKIQISHRNKDLVEEKDWLWIKAIKSTDDYFVLELNQKPSFIIHFSKSKLSEAQIDFFENREVI